MITRETEIVNRLGLHARAAAKLVHTAGRYQSQVIIAKEGEEVDAKSILGLMLLAAAQGSRVTIICTGNDEESAMADVLQLIANRFEEES